VTDINISTNSLYGVTPDALGSMSGLASLNISTNRFTGLGTGLSNSPSLVTLIASYNPLNTTIPSWMSGLDLVSLTITSGGLVGSIPSWIGNMTSLRFLILSDNYLQGTIPSSLAQAT